MDLDIIVTDYDEEFGGDDLDEEIPSSRLSRWFLRPAYYGTSQQCTGGFRNEKNSKRAHRH